MLVLSAFAMRLYGLAFRIGQERLYFAMIRRIFLRFIVTGAIPYAVKTLLEAKRRRDAGESLVLPRSAARKGGAV